MLLKNANFNRLKTALSDGIRFSCMQATPKTKQYRHLSKSALCLVTSLHQLGRFASTPSEMPQRYSGPGSGRRIARQRDAKASGLSDKKAEHFCSAFFVAILGR